MTRRVNTALRRFVATGTALMLMSAALAGCSAAPKNTAQEAERYLMENVNGALAMLDGEPEVRSNSAIPCALPTGEEGVVFDIRLTAPRGGDSPAIVSQVHALWASNGVPVEPLNEERTLVSTGHFLAPGESEAPIKLLSFMSQHNMDPSPEMYPDGYVLNGLTQCATGKVEDFPDWESWD